MYLMLHAMRYNANTRMCVCVLSLTAIGSRDTIMEIISGGIPGVPPIPGFLPTMLRNCTSYKNNTSLYLL